MLCTSNVELLKQPVLLLLAFSVPFPDRQTPDLCNQAKPMKPFLFYHVQTDINSTFESVAFPSWFIASSKRGQPIFLTSDLGRMYSTAFRMNLRI